MSRLLEDRRLIAVTVAAVVVLAAVIVWLLAGSSRSDRETESRSKIALERQEETSPESESEPKPKREPQREPKPKPKPEPAVRSESRADIGAVPGAPSRAFAGAGEVLVVGDSLEVATSPHLEAYLPGVPLTVDAEKSASSATILGFLRRSYLPDHSVVVFDAGTNDDPAFPEDLAANLAAAAELVGRRCLVVPTVHRPPFNGVGPGAINDTIRSFAASRPRTEVPDWAGTVRSRPEVLEPDGVHPTAAGAEERARLIAAAVSACLGSS